uniref:Pentraxin family member n=1 Tax=Knipowitschia caucasica TaxID=637954 RepID=A0AAV2KEK2_KNICA
MLISKSAADENLFRKMFTFPQESTTAHVLLQTGPVSFTALSLCFRSFTDSPQPHTFFSLTMNSTTNDLLVHYEPKPKSVVLQVGGAEVRYRGVDFPLNQWNSLCLTWEASSGIAHLWLNDRGLTRKYTSESHMNGSATIVLGQVLKGGRKYD